MASDFCGRSLAINARALGFVIHARASPIIIMYVSRRRARLKTREEINIRTLCHAAHRRSGPGSQPPPTHQPAQPAPSAPDARTYGPEFEFRLAKLPVCRLTPDTRFAFSAQLWPWGKIAEWIKFLLPFAS